LTKIFYIYIVSILVVIAVYLQYKLIHNIIYTFEIVHTNKQLISNVFTRLQVTGWTRKCAVDLYNYASRISTASNRNFPNFLSSDTLFT